MIDFTSFSTKSGVYIMKDAKNVVLYIGKAKNLRSRIQQYFRLQDERAMVPVLIEQVSSIDTIITQSEKEALLLENTLIKQHRPKYNVCLKDDKTFLSLQLNIQHEWPMVKLVRLGSLSKDKNLFFGPYTNAFAARKTFELLKKLFPLRKCSDHELYRRKRPCILHGMRMCLAPCVGLCTKEEYDGVVKDLTNFMKGDIQSAIQHLTHEREKASSNLQFEKAKIYHDLIDEITSLSQTSSAVYPMIKIPVDVIGFYRFGQFIFIVKLLFREGKLTSLEHFSFSPIISENETALSSFLVQHYSHVEDLPQAIYLPFLLHDIASLREIFSGKSRIEVPKIGAKKKLIDLAQLNAKEFYQAEKDQLLPSDEILPRMQEILHLKNIPTRIECFDTSNISGKDAVAAMVSFIDGKIDRKAGRLYKIRGGKGDDYSAMKEVLSRRYQKKDPKFPDLIIVDGGKGQLSLIASILEQLDIIFVDVLALSKEEGRHDKGITQEKIHLLGQSEAIRLDPYHPILFFLQRIRDEAHRKAITFHKKKRAQTTFTSILDQIDGIGPKKKQFLLQHFKSPKAALLASKEELQKIQGLSERDIVRIQERAKDLMY